MNELLNRLEKERKIRHKQMVINKTIYIGFPILSFVILVLTYYFQFLLIFSWLPLIAIIVLGLLYKKNVKIKEEFDDLLNEELLPALIKEQYIDLIEYTKTPEIDISEANKHAMFNHCKQRHFYDQIQAVYNDYNFSMYGALLAKFIIKHNPSNYERYHYGRGTTSVPIAVPDIEFRGKIIRIEFPEKVNFKMKIIEGGFSVGVTGYYRIQTPYDNLNKKFRTYVTDRSNAMEFLTPELVDLILKTDKENKAKVHYVVDEDALYIYLYNYKERIHYKISQPLPTVGYELLKKDVNVVKPFIDVISKK